MLLLLLSGGGLVWRLGAAARRLRGLQR